MYSIKAILNGENEDNLIPQKDRVAGEMNQRNISTGAYPDMFQLPLRFLEMQTICFIRCRAVEEFVRVHILPLTENE